MTRNTKIAALMLLVVAGIAGLILFATARGHHFREDWPMPLITSAAMIGMTTEGVAATGWVAAT